MSSVERNTKGDGRYWRSLNELADAPEFRRHLEREFPAGGDSPPAGVSRRRWLQLMGASMALGAASGCRWEREEIRPFVKRPEGHVPGVPERYATAYDLSGTGRSLTVTAFDGRPIKVEGNANHPMSLGATDAWAQAAILEFYDPDRNARVLLREQAGQRAASWDEALSCLRAAIGTAREAGGAGLAILAEPDSSPTRARLQVRLREALPAATWFEYAPFSDDQCRAGAVLAFGRGARSQYRLGEADVIACLDADPLGHHPAALRHARDFAARRDPDRGPMNRLYVVEAGYSTTGVCADHRLPLRAGHVPTLASALEQAVTVLLDGKSPAAGDTDRDRFVRVLASDLVEHRGMGLVVAGPNQPAAVHAAVHRMNQALRNAGKTVVYTALPDEGRPTHVDAIGQLAQAMRDGQVKTLLVLGGNPVFDAPADVAFASALARVPESFHLGVYNDETSRACRWHLPRAHFLESWGDVRAYDGTYSVTQPIIAPLYGGKSAIELLAALLEENPPGPRQLVRETFQAVGGGASEADWRRTLHDGLLPESGGRPLELFAQPRSASEPELAATSGDGGFELVFCLDPAVHDGRFANNGWLQELPDPLTKITWDNAVLVGPATAERLGIVHESLATLARGGRSLDIAAYVLPGVAEGSLMVTVGYGRTAAGHVGGDTVLGVESVGVDTYALRTAEAMSVATDVAVSVAKGRYRLATTQDHHAIDRVGAAGRDARVGQLVRATTEEHYRQHPEFVEHVVHTPELKSLWAEKAYDGHRWGMTIDLSKCTGCSACVVACQAENNVPIVGKRETMRGREMHWLRIDRYFEGAPEDPSVAIQPVACHQCELAPCEQVCPVAATVHSAEGLNDMAYNRCIGTRYCANNCPYKVRRFNYFNWHKDLKDARNEVVKLMYNPDVTIRHRGVMEKCTYCVQRIQAAKIEAKNAGRAVGEGEIQVACQQVCPAQAIAFGDLADETSAVAAGQRSNRAYALLAELNIKPRTEYLARIRNPHPLLGGTPELSDDERSGHTG
ncbi:MAG: 4Fe-4S dicluster domain-containing protein [Planctomycetes bacterium]|nr:4Fe-4S dicluster domain-containing protein [Planctomycetota bacterium]